MTLTVCTSNKHLREHLFSSAGDMYWDNGTCLLTDNVNTEHLVFLKGNQITDRPFSQHGHGTALGHRGAALVPVSWLEPAMS